MDINNNKAILSTLIENEILLSTPQSASFNNMKGLPERLESPDFDHSFSAHPPLWNYENPTFSYPYAQAGLPKVFETLPPKIAVTEVLSKTRFIVFLGAANTPAFRRCLEEPGAFILIFDSDASRVAHFAAQVRPGRLVNRALILLGHPDEFIPSLSDILPPNLFNLGFPVFFTLPEIAAPQQAKKTIEAIEILFYRYRIYGLSGQGNFCNLPMRPIRKELFYDQQLHFYSNINEYLRWPSINPLRKAFLGETAVLVAAGPDLPNHLQYLRDVRDSAVIIAVNNALKPLLKADIHPQFVVANDTSVHTARSWEGLAPLPDVYLVAHCLTNMGGDIFPRKFTFGNHKPEVFGTRPELRLHGSVMSTAFSLARHMGCAKCVFVGAQLSSPDPWTMSYSKGSIHENRATNNERPLTDRWPQLVPVKDMAGTTCYTTLNFLDAAHWLRDEIRLAQIPCVNISAQTILHGPGITLHPGYPIRPTGRLPLRLQRIASATEKRPAMEPVGQFVKHELRHWINIESEVASILQTGGDDFFVRAGKALEQFDATNVTYLVQRFDNFNNKQFHADVFESKSKDVIAEGLRSYFSKILQMAKIMQSSLVRNFQ